MIRSISQLATLAICFGTLSLAVGDRPHFEPNWESLNSRQTPQWFADAKFGIFIHWGVYSVPAICDTSTYSEWYQHWLNTNSHGGLVRKFHEENYGPEFKYRQFAPMFRAELWAPEDWASLFKRAGAKYVVLVSKHHDGFALWPSELASQSRGYAWNSMETGPRRDLCGELAQAVRAAGLKMGFYYSFMEWENPLYDADKSIYVEQHMIPQLKDLVARYQPDIFWPDGEWDHPDTLWRSPETLAWLYNNVENYDSFVVNDRWGKALRGQCGDYYTTEYGHVGGGSPGLADARKPFEECRGIGHSFAFNRLEGYDFYLDRGELVQLLIDKVSRGGGLLLNLGPAADGRIPLLQQDRLIALGDWLSVHGEAIYGTTGSLFQDLPFGRSTTRGNTVYLHVFQWPADGQLEVPGLTTGVEKAYLLHDPEQTALKLSNQGVPLSIDLTGYHPHEYASVVAVECSGPPIVDNSIVPDGEGHVMLTPRRAELADGLVVEQTALNDPGGLAGVEFGYHIGQWNNLDATATWLVRLEPGRQYQVRIEWACPADHSGGGYQIAVGDERIAGRVDGHTAGWQEYEVTNIGEIRAPRNGDKSPAGVAVSVVARATDLPAGKSLANVRCIELSPMP